MASAILFAVAHVSFTSAFLWALLLGLLAGLARLRTGSLVPGMVLVNVALTASMFKAGPSHAS